MALSPQQRSRRARLAALKRHHPEADHTDAERDLKAASAEAYIRSIVESAPPLTGEQLARLRALLPAAPAGAMGGDSDAAA